MNHEDSASRLLGARSPTDEEQAVEACRLAAARLLDSSTRVRAVLRKNGIDVDNPRLRTFCGFTLSERREPAASRSLWRWLSDLWRRS